MIDVVASTSDGCTLITEWFMKFAEVMKEAAGVPHLIKLISRVVSIDSQYSQTWNRSELVLFYLG